MLNRLGFVHLAVKILPRQRAVLEDHIGVRRALLGDRDRAGIDVGKGIIRAVGGNVGVSAQQQASANEGNVNVDDFKVDDND